jgi:two-component system, NarL family, response regulator DegU
LNSFCTANQRSSLHHLQVSPLENLVGESTVKLARGSSGKSPRVLVADSNLTQSQLLSSALRRQTDMEVTSCRGELTECIQVLRSASADIVLLGGGAPYQNPIDTLRSLNTSHPHMGLILLLDRYDRNLVVNAMRAGARGLFCLACQPFRALCRCISVVHQGQFWINTEQLGYLIEALSSVPQGRIINTKGETDLTPREEQVMSLVAEGMANREVAQQLGIKEDTVKKALLRIYDKLGVSNRVELVMYALTHHPVDKTPAPTASAPRAAERLALRLVSVSPEGPARDS